MIERDDSDLDAETTREAVVRTIERDDLDLDAKTMREAVVRMMMMSQERAESYLSQIPVGDGEASCSCRWMKEKTTELFYVFLVAFRTRPEL